MYIIIRYKTDSSMVPYGTDTEVKGQYLCAWSTTSFDHAKQEILRKVREFLHPIIVPEPETVEVEE